VDTTLRGLLDLLAADDVETRCATLLVLSRLGAQEPKVVQQVGAAIEAKNAIVRDFAVGYFEQVRPKEGLGYLVPLLDSEDEALRRRAIAILASYGASAVSAVRKLTAAAPRRRLNAIIEICARVRSSAALDLLFELMDSDDLDTNRAACDALLQALPQLDAKARADLSTRSEALAAGADGRRTALVAAAKLLGALADPKARKRLLAMLDPRQPHIVRTHAIAALLQCLRGQKLTDKEIATCLALLDSDDEAGILRPAVHLLEDQTLDRSYLNRLNQLAESPQPVVKRFAIQKLGSFESGSVVKTLMGYLTDDSYARRDQAATSLKKLPAARLPLMKEFLACEEERRAWALAEILLAHDRDWKRDVLGSLWDRLQSALEKREDRLYTAYFHFLNALDSEQLAEQVRERAELHRKKKSFAAAMRWLQLLKDGPAFDEETRFALSIAEIKAHPRAVSSIVKRHDPSLDRLRELARSAFPLSERLRKERALEPADLFYIAFQLAEGGREERAVAGELLEHIAAKHGRTKVGKASKNKLRLLTGAAR
jgi:hypothetical protein